MRLSARFDLTGFGRPPSFTSIFKDGKKYFPFKQYSPIFILQIIFRSFECQKMYTCFEDDIDFLYNQDFVYCMVTYKVFINQSVYHGFYIRWLLRTRCALMM